MDTKEPGVGHIGTSATVTLPRHEAVAARARSRFSKFLTDPEPSLRLQTVTLMIAVLVAFILIAIPD